jgi:hypothetical protein
MLDGERKQMCGAIFALQAELHTLGNHIAYLDETVGDPTLPRDLEGTHGLIERLLDGLDDVRWAQFAYDDGARKLGEALAEFNTPSS